MKNQKFLRVFRPREEGEGGEEQKIILPPIPKNDDEDEEEKNNFKISDELLYSF